jgi:acyl-CoA thioesterase FadM
MNERARQHFQRERLIRFSDCDPAGIVFYPQYFVMFNGLVEDWFGEALGLPYADVLMRRRLGLPTVRVEADFRAVSRLGDRVALSLGVERLGGRSLTLELRCTDAVADAGAGAGADAGAGGHRDHLARHAPGRRHPGGPACGHRARRGHSSVSAGAAGCHSSSQPRA